MNRLETLNRSLYLHINASVTTPAWEIHLVAIVAEILIYAVPLLLFCLWFSGREEKRRLAVKAFVAAVIGLACNQVIGMLWQHPRPFVVGLGHTFLLHAPDSSFPSDHATVLFSIGLTLLLSGAKRSGLILLLLGVLVGWARVFLGVHFPLDILGAAAVGGIAYTIVNPQWAKWGGPITEQLEKVYRNVFAKPISLGWIRS